MSRRVGRVLASTCSSKLDGEEEGEAFPSFFHQYTDRHGQARTDPPEGKGGQAKIVVISPDL